MKVRQRVRRRRGEGLVIGPLKSRYSRRDVPITPTLVDRLLALGAAPDELVFRSTAVSVLDPDNLATRVLAPACERHVGGRGRGQRVLAEDQIDNVVSDGTQVLIPPDAGKRDTPRRGWDGGRYAFMRTVLAGELGGGLYRNARRWSSPCSLRPSTTGASISSSGAADPRHARNGG